MSAADPTHGAMPPAVGKIERIEKLKGGDLNDLCEAADEAIRAEGGFGWLKPPPRDVMERYWRGVLAVPERTLFAARLDGLICGSIQLVRPPRNNEAQAMGVHLTTAFMAPWGRGHGLAKALVEAAEAQARAESFAVANVDIRESQTAGIAVCEALGYTLWGIHPFYARVDGNYVRGRFYFKNLTEGLADK
jgi:RimJ/RimL family protein N-acetyltransferase